jgi:hypothetical protein
MGEFLLIGVFVGVSIFYLLRVLSSRDKVIALWVVVLGWFVIMQVAEDLAKFCFKSSP